MIYRLRTISLSACLMAAVLALTCKDAAAGFGPPANPAFGSNAANASSWLAGAHAGYNWQQGAAVFGFETDLQATHLNSTMSGGLTHSPPIIPLPASDFASTTALIEYYGTVRGRLGWSAGQWMFFGTAGAAYGNVELSSTFSTLGLRTFSQTSEQKIGWVVGAGFEYLLRPNLMLSLGYQYVDLGRIGISSTTTGISGPSSVTLSQAATVHAQFQTVMAGMSWRFAPGSSSPWAGGYAGGQGGGAWGNNTAATYASSQFTPSDMRLKRDIGLLARRGDGLGLYSFKYVWSDTVYVGVMAQEVALLYPDAVQRDDLTGYMAVNYTRLGLQPMILR
ncbi:MAG TPA: outer membrane beta-barrel protein [Bradyrhizobium sp.]|nr:outer membrane beta-barrel protein [Bradyrhizobium sp.]